MKKLYIVRHAKSSWKDLSLDDFNRPLNKRGKMNALMMAKRLSIKEILPDLIISSPAVRARKTAKILKKQIKYDQKILFNKKIYEADEKILHKILSNLDDEIKSIFLVGHNSGLNFLAEKYVSFNENIPTCGIVEIEFECKKWSNISKNNASLISFDYPKKTSSSLV